MSWGWGVCEIKNIPLLAEEGWRASAGVVSSAANLA